MKEYKLPELIEEQVEIEDVIALSLGDHSNPDHDPFFPEYKNIPHL